MSLKRFLYSFALYLLLPVVVIRLIWRSRRNPAYRQRIAERFGFINVDSQLPIIWLHAVSVGEAIAAKPLVEALILQYPNHRILMTTTTPTGSDRVKAMFSNRVEHVYFPYDLQGAVNRFLKRVAPHMLIIMETEIWPNLYAKCHEKKIPLFVVNARLSSKSTESYKRIKSLVSETLGYVSAIAVRSDIDAKNFKNIGAPSNKVQVVGNIKYDFQFDYSQIEAGKNRELWINSSHTFKQQKPDFIQNRGDVKRPVWVAASTHEKEDESVLSIFEKLILKYKSLILVIIPRHPERFDDVYNLCKEFSSSKVLRHSQNHYDHLSLETQKQFNIILGDSMGEMQSWFAMADIAFIGGSLVKTGGHNPLEATAFGIPVVSGPHMFNFEDIATNLHDQQLLFSGDEKYIHGVLDEYFSENLLEAQKSYKQRADHFMQQHRGVTSKLIQLFESGV